ncbi:ORF2R [Ictalurid herpesvirus 1]|nr:ORF2L [Ictalurid herpesvirus 1]QAB08563.1 ORF2R [Ictalurid herpesvirus 1]
MPRFQRDHGASHRYTPMGKRPGPPANTGSHRGALLGRLNGDPERKGEFTAVSKLLKSRGYIPEARTALIEWVEKEGARRGGFEVMCGSILLPGHDESGRAIDDIFRDMSRSLRGDAPSPIDELLFRVGNLLEVYVETATGKPVPAKGLWGVVQVESTVTGIPKMIHMCIDRSLGVGYKCSFAKLWKKTIEELLGTGVGTTNPHCWFTRTIHSDAIQASFDGLNMIFELFGGRVRTGRVSPEGERRVFHTRCLGDDSFNALFAATVHDPTVSRAVFEARVRTVQTSYPAWYTFGDMWTPAPNNVGWVTTPEGSWCYDIRVRDLYNDPNKMSVIAATAAPRGVSKPEREEESKADPSIGSPTPNLCALYTSGDSVELHAPLLPL